MFPRSVFPIVPATVARNGRGSWNRRQHNGRHIGRKFSTAGLQLLQFLQLLLQRLLFWRQLGDVTHRMSLWSHEHRKILPKRLRTKCFTRLHRLQPLLPTTKILPKPTFGSMGIVLCRASLTQFTMRDRNWLPNVLCLRPWRSWWDLCRLP